MALLLPSYLSYDLNDASLSLSLSLSLTNLISNDLTTH